MVVQKVKGIMVVLLCAKRVSSFTNFEGWRVKRGYGATQKCFLK